MGRYSKLYSNYILQKKHQNIKEGVIMERDWVTIGERHRLEPGKKPYYNNGNFLFTDNNLPFFKKKHNNGKWVAHLVYDDVKDANPDVNTVIVNQDSDDLRSYAYYGSAEDLIKKSIENIIRYFPGRLETTDSDLFVINSEGESIDTGKPMLKNSFGIDMHTETVSSSDFDNSLKYLTASYKQYNVVDIIDGVRETVHPIKEYTVENAEAEIYESDKYHKMGYDYIRYKDFLFKWDEDEGKFVPVKYSDDCTNYFVKCDEYIRYLDEYYMWSEEEARYILLNVLEICNDNYQKIYSITIITEEGYKYVVDMYNVENEAIYCLNLDESHTDNIIIEPKQEIIDEYFGSLEGFEKKLLTRDTNPFYKNIFKVPYELSNGAYSMGKKTFVWPSRDYCIDIDSVQYNTFINDILDMAALYDELYSDCIWRCMTHESIKNFDWTYRREYSENDSLDNIEGGERMKDVLHFYGRIYDDVKRYVDGIKMANNITYDGYDNIDNAEISDKNNDKGWDIVSTMWEPYYYEEIEEVPSDAEVTPLPVVPSDVNCESPEYISIGCKDGVALYQKKYNDPSIEFVTEAFLQNEDYITGNEDPWIRYNHNLMYVNIECLPDGAVAVELDEIPVITKDTDPDYVSVDGVFYRKSHVMYVRLGSSDPMKHFINYWTDFNTMSSVPSTITNSSPEYIRVVNGLQYDYYKLTDRPYDNSEYMHRKWFPTRNPNSVTPSSTDINFQRRLNLSTNRIFKTKGTRASIDMVMALFGLGESDYTITEYYNETSPIEATSIFYYYNELDEEPEGITWDSTNTFTTLDEAIEGISENSPKYIKVDDGETPYYYELNGDYTYEEIILEFYKHKTVERRYDDIYTGTPINQLMIGNTKYIIPYYSNQRVYDGNLYYQQYGGWGKKNDSVFPYDYSETVPYMHLVPNVEALLSTNSMSLSYGDIYYVFDIDDYVEFDEDVPFDLSHFFKVIDQYNPQRFSSWKYIPMEGEIVYKVDYDKNNVTHEDYLHAKYLNDIIPTVLFNNPHTGNGNYDLGADFYEYMKTPYKYLFETYNFDDSKYVNISKQFRFTLDRIVAYDNSEKFTKWLNTISYFYLDGTLDYAVNNFDSSKYFINNKLIIFKNLLDNTFHKKFLKDVVMKYVLQVIPSTAILVLDGFEITQDTEDMKTYTITVTPNDEEYGKVTGGGEYIHTMTAILKAYENDGFHFVRWDKIVDGEPIPFSENPVVKVMVCDDAEYIGVFENDCLIDTACNTTCDVSLSCDVAEICSTTLLCEIEDQGDVDPITPETPATVAYNLKWDGAETAEETANSLIDYALVFDNTCSAYETVANSQTHDATNVWSEPCRVTLFPTTIDKVDPDTLETIPSVKTYTNGTELNIVAGRMGEPTLKEWDVTTPDNVTSRYLNNPLTLNLTSGTTKITAVYYQEPNE